MMNPTSAEILMGRLMIPNQHLGEDVPLLLYPEQRRLLELLCQGKDTIVCKSRQVGSSTLCLAYVCLKLISNKNYKVAVVAHKSKIAKQLTRDLKRLVLQTGMEVVRDASDFLQIENGSQVDVLTAGAKDAGRSRTYHLILCSEAAYYEESEEMMSSLLKARFLGNSQVILESTAQAKPTHYRQMWESDSFEHFFSPFESHVGYRADPDLISDELWENLKSLYGFTRRDSAAYWWEDYRKNASDISKQLREFPIQPEHAWLSAAGRWINKDPHIRPYTSYIKNTNIHIFDQPNPDHLYVFGVDTASGKLSDQSVAVVYCLNTGQIAASFADNATGLEGLVEVCVTLAQLYKPKNIYVENNGIGESTYQYLVRKGLPVYPYVAKTNSRYLGFVWARKQIEAGLASDEHLLVNCQSCIVKTSKSGNIDFTGQKDVLAALSFIGVHADTFPDMLKEAKPRQILPGHYDMLADMDLNAHRKRRR
jgi:hypothetical protein